MDIHLLHYCLFFSFPSKLTGLGLKGGLQWSLTVHYPLMVLNVLTTQLLETHSEEHVNSFSPSKLLLDHVSFCRLNFCVYKEGNTNCATLLCFSWFSVRHFNEGKSSTLS